MLDKTPSIPWHLIAVFFLLILFIGGAGYHYFSVKKDEIEHIGRSELSAIAALKVDEISRWRRERLADAAVLAADPFVGRATGEWLREGKANAAAAMRAWMEAFGQNGHYSEVLLVTNDGEVRWSTGGITAVGENVRSHLPEVQCTRKPLLLDFHRASVYPAIHSNLLVPIVDKDAPEAPVIGVLVLKIDPHSFLFPLIRHWPTPSPTAETLLVRLDGDEVVYLNELRHQEGTALAFRLPAAAQELPAAMAVRGEEGIVQGTDYRGVPVLAALRAVPDSPWFLVSKMDLAEIQAPIRQRALLTVVFAGLITLSSGAGLLLLWSRRTREELEAKVLERTAELSATAAHLRQEMEERQRAERAARESSRYFESFFSHSITPLVILDKDFNFIRVNEAYAKSGSRRVEEFEGRNHFEFYPSDARAIFEDVVRTKQPYMVEARPFSYPDHPEWGVTYWDWSLVPILDENGEVDFLVFSLKEVTDRTKAEQAIRENEALLGNVLDTLPAGVWITVREGRIVRGNPAGREIWAGATFVGIDRYDEYKSWWADTGKRIETEDRALFRALKKGETSINEVIEIESFDRNRKIILNSAAPVRDAEGKIISAIVVNEDITDKRLAETYTLASNTLLKHLSQASSRKEYADAAVELLRELSRCRCAGLRLLDDKGAIPYESYTGYSKEFWEQENGIIAARNDCACTRVVTGDTEHQDAPYLTPAGSFYCGNTAELLASLSDEEKTRYRGTCIKSGFASVAVIPLRYEGRVLGAIHLADERERLMSLKTIEMIESLGSLIAEAVVKFETRQELEHYMEKLKQSNKALEEFAYITSHDLQEPLRKITAFGDRLCSKFGQTLGAEGEDYIRRMQAASERMQRLILALLSYSRVTSKPRSFTEVSLGEIVEDVLADLEVRIEETGADVHVGELPTIMADPHQMRQLFQNLVGNALKYQDPEQRPHVRIHSAFSRNGTCRVAVEDNGIGFDEKYLDRIFAPFQRLHGRSSSYEGTGMGLAICRKIVERHGGSITARSTPGKGSTFIVEFPNSRQSQPQVQLGHA